MKRMLSYTVAVIAPTVFALGMWLGVSAPAQAASANGPYYATPSWDQKLDANTRFIVLLNWNSQAVLDRETGLVWEQSPDAAARDWFASGDHCRSITKGNRKGWRLPTINELQSLVDPSVNQPSLPLGHPFVGVLIGAPNVSDLYWSSTTDAQSQANAILTGFSEGSASNSISKPSSEIVVGPGIIIRMHAWCVRGQGGGDPQ